MRILITGNMGYVGPVVARHLRRVMPDAELVGFDNALFAHCLTTTDRLPEAVLDAQYFGDVRELPGRLLSDVDAVVSLAALSNDPLGKRLELVTDEVNRKANLLLAERAHAAGVRSFVFASSCSIYGAATGDPRREDDPLNPLTAYARSKIGTEEGLRQSDLDGMTVTCLRFATACGMSPRLRLDLVLNDFVACAVAAGEIAVLSDGTPWRPLIDVSDMARAVEWAVVRSPDHGAPVLSVNVGSRERNHRVRDLAEAVAEAVPGTRVSINANAPVDLRSYRVDFSLFRRLAPDHQPLKTLADSINDLVTGLTALGFQDRNFRESSLIRLSTLSKHMESHALSPDLRWL